MLENSRNTHGNNKEKQRNIPAYSDEKISGYKNAKTTGMAIAAIFDPMSYSESICGVVTKI
jgi:hypothetical protein